MKKHAKQHQKQPWPPHALRGIHDFLPFAPEQKQHHTQHIGYMLIPGFPAAYPIQPAKKGGSIDVAVSGIPEENKKHAPAERQQQKPAYSWHFLPQIPEFTAKVCQSRHGLGRVLVMLAEEGIILKANRSNLPSV